MTAGSDGGSVWSRRPGTTASGHPSAARSRRPPAGSAGGCGCRCRWRIAVDQEPGASSYRAAPTSLSRPLWRPVLVKCCCHGLSSDLVPLAEKSRSAPCLPGPPSSHTMCGCSASGRPGSWASCTTSPLLLGRPPPGPASPLGPGRRPVDAARASTAPSYHCPTVLPTPTAFPPTATWARPLCACPAASRTVCRSTRPNSATWHDYCLSDGAPRHLTPFWAPVTTAADRSSGMSGARMQKSLSVSSATTASSPARMRWRRLPERPGPTPVDAGLWASLRPCRNSSLT